MSSPRPHPRSRTREWGSTHSPMTLMSTVLFSTTLLTGGSTVSDGEVEGIGLGALEEAPEEAVELVAFEEERVVAEVGVELGVAGPLVGAQEGEGDRPVLLRGKQPVAGESDDERLGLDRAEGELEGSRGPGRVEMVDGPRDVEVVVGVEAVDEALALVAEVALDLELGVEGVGLAAGRVAAATAELA